MQVSIHKGVVKGFTQECVSFLPETGAIEAPRSPRSTAVRQNLQGMRSLYQFKGERLEFFFSGTFRSRSGLQQRKAALPIHNASRLCAQDFIEDDFTH